MHPDSVPGEALLVTTLDGTNASFPGELLTCSGNQLSFRCDGDLKQGSPVRVDWGELLVLAEIHVVHEDHCHALIRHLLRRSDLAHFRAVWKDH